MYQQTPAARTLSGHFGWHVFEDVDEQIEFQGALKHVPLAVCERDSTVTDAVSELN